MLELLMSHFPMCPATLIMSMFFHNNRIHARLNVMVLVIQYECSAFVSVWKTFSSKINGMYFDLLWTFRVAQTAGSVWQRGNGEITEPQRDVGTWYFRANVHQHPEGWGLLEPKYGHLSHWPDRRQDQEVVLELSTGGGRFIYCRR